MIEQGMARAQKVACRPGDDRCYALPNDAASAQHPRTSKGRCKMGGLVANSGRDSWDIWLDLHTGEGRLQRQRD